jgi:hypothetical protein
MERKRGNKDGRKTGKEEREDEMEVKVMILRKRVRKKRDEPIICGSTLVGGSKLPKPSKPS